MKAPSPIPDADLHALVDGRLTPDEALRIENRLADDPIAAAQVAAWRAQREALSTHLREALDEPVDPRLAGALHALVGLHAEGAERPGSWRTATLDWRHWGGIAAGLAVAFLAGWAGHGQWEASSFAQRGAPGVQGFARQALAAHVVYAPEVRHPVEVEAAQQEHLVQWLSKRLGRPLKVPQLNALGYRLVGGRLLPGEGPEPVPRAQFMYENAAGERLTLYVGAVPASGETAFRFTRQGRSGSFYWVDRGFGYALAGQVSREQLLPLAQEVYRQIDG